jgi:putative FmdB family regulatory protein
MPIFEYICSKCSKAFTILQLNKKEEKKKCPHCGSKNVSKKISSFSCASSSGFSRGGSTSSGMG